MNKSVIGQVVAFFILVVPVLILSWFIITPTTNGGNSGIITTIAVWVLGAVLIAILLYFASAIAWKHRGKGAIAINGVKGFFGTEKTKGIEKFMENEDRFWLLGFIVVAVITILLYTVLDEKSSDRWVTVGLITLVGMHVFIFWNFFQALFYGDKLHPSTKFFLGGCLIFWSIALFVPNFAQEMVKGTKGMVTAFDDRFDPEKASAKAETEQQPSSEAISSLGLSTVAIVVPVGATIEVDRPSGHYLASVNCPKEVVMEVTDVSTGQLIKQQDCAETVRNGNLPLNIKLAFFQKGDDGGPVDVLVRWKKIS